MTDSIQKAWNYLWSNLFYEKTSLFYDYRVSQEKDGLISTLPCPEMVRRQIPNPCGWGIGMEDSVINNAMMLDTVVSRYLVTKDPALKPYADKLFAGLKLCATVSKRSGFIVRSVLPFDGVSHYINSSRDQYTHWIYSAYRFYDSGLSDREQKEDVKNILVSVAKRMEADVTEENDFQLLREDGKIGIVQKMWGQLGAHEYLRLPIFYAAAFKISGDDHWKKMYLSYRDEATVLSEKIDYEKIGGVYPVLQMQYSLALLFDAEDDEIYKSKYRNLMKRASAHYHRQAVLYSKELCKPEHKNDFCYQYRDWRYMPAKFDGYIGQMPYYNPNQCSLEENQSFYPVRNVGDAAAIGALCGDAPDDVISSVTNLCDRIDFDNHYSSAPLNLINAFWLLKEIKKEI